MKNRYYLKVKWTIRIFIMTMVVVAYAAIMNFDLDKNWKFSRKKLMEKWRFSRKLSTSETSAYDLACDLTGYPPEYDPIVGHGSFTCNQLEGGAIVLLMMGTLYMFLALAVVCDEFFVPALERIGENMDISDDVAGATLMAAGGSAPELFTSFLGVFVAGSDVGFGTIVGSAVFNVLFVIGMCAIYSKEVLVLTWWPLARDCTYYSISLAILAIFFEYFNDGPVDGNDNPKQILWWESLVLFGMYIGYVYLMSKNEQLHQWVLKKFMNNDKYTADSENLESNQTVVIQVQRNTTFENRTGSFTNFNRPSKFRSGVLQLLISDKSMLETAGIHVVSQIEGDAIATFKNVASLCIGENSDGNTMNIEEFNVMLSKINPGTTEAESKEAFNIIDVNKNGIICVEEFSAWYKTSEARVAAERTRAFELIDTDQSGTIDRNEFKKVLSVLDVVAGKDEVENSFNELDANGDGTISKDEFQEWYERSIFFRSRLKELSEEIEAPDAGHYPSWPQGEAISAKVFYIISLPIIILLYSTIPCVSNEKYKGLYIPAFFGSILWTGVFSYFMIWWSNVIGDLAGVPPQIMGLTVLAAGTSVPDLLSSVIVAMQGKGDMAVSSSIGSNIFDVLVGLPVPWFFYSIAYGKPQTVKSESLVISVLVLLVMLLLVVGTIAMSNWRMTKKLGGAMFVLYLIFVAQDLARAL